MCEVCEEDVTRTQIRQSLAWLDMADAVNALMRKTLMEKQRLLDAAPRPVSLWEDLAMLDQRCKTEVDALQSGLGQTRQ